MVATIGQTSAFVGQGGPSNLQRFKELHSPTFKGGGDPMVADHWFRQVDKILKAIKITSNAMRIRLAAFQLEVNPKYGGLGQSLEELRGNDMERVP